MPGLLTDCIKVSEIATSKIITDILAAGCSLNISFKMLSNLCLAWSRCVCVRLSRFKANKSRGSAFIIELLFTYGRLFCLKWHKIAMR